jgi:hypothetical protein
MFGDDVVSGDGQMVTMPDGSKVWNYPNTVPSTPSQVAAAKAAVQANPSLLTVPTPGGVAVAPGTGLFAQAAQNNNKPLYVPGPVLSTASIGGNIPEWVVIGGGVLGVLFVLTMVFGRKK